MAELITVGAAEVVREVGTKLIKKSVKTINNEIAKASDNETLQKSTKQFNKAFDKATEVLKECAELGTVVVLGSQLNNSLTQPQKIGINDPSIEGKNEIKFANGIMIRNDGILVHPNTRVQYVKKEIINPVTGQKEIYSFPEFDSVFEAQLSEDLYTSSDLEQFNECNKQLKDWCENNTEEANNKFSQSQLEQINANEAPKGYTWHHNEDVGKMQLVDSEIHQQTGHTGGRAIWGGGTQNR